MFKSVVWCVICCLLVGCQSGSSMTEAPSPAQDVGLDANLDTAQNMEVDLGDDAAALPCSERNTLTCTEDGDCVHIEGRALYNDGSEMLCVDFDEALTPLGCMEAEGGCGGAETLAASPEDPDACWWFPSTCVPEGWTTCAETTYRACLDHTVPCRLPLPEDAREGEDVRCVDRVVQERPEAPEVMVHAVVFDEAFEATPVYLLQGGPAILGASYVPYLDMPTRRARFGERPVIYIEQRGVGASQPALSCSSRLFLSSCARATRENGIMLEDFNITRTADDVAALAGMLRHREILIAGGSYGSRLGLEVLRRHSNLVKGAFLESLVQPDEAFLADFVTGMQSTLGELFALCDADPTCAARPTRPADDLITAFENAAERPIDTEYGLLEPTLLAFILVEVTYQQDFLGAIPSGLAAIVTEDLDGINAFAALAFERPPRVENLANAVSLCLHSAPVFSRTRFNASLQELHPALRPGFAPYRNAFDVCDTIAIEPGPEEAHVRVMSDVPTLLLAPELDGRTPPSNAQQVAEGLPNSHVIVLEGRTHTPALGFQYEGAYFDDCAASILRAFLDDPEGTPDASCASPVPIVWR